MREPPRHISVLHTTVLRILQPQSGESVLDCTLGLGGHSAAFLEAIAPDGCLTALDADETNLAAARTRLEPFGQRVRLLHANFRDVASLDLGVFDCVFADLGLSSPHIDNSDRGFSFRFDGPLDLRYDRSIGRGATEYLEEATEDDIVMLLHDYGEVHSYVRPLARLLAGKRIESTFALKKKVEEIFTYRAPSILPKVFQALRIAVNDELTALESLLAAVPLLLKPRGRAGVISYHSLEDRLVKRAFRTWTEPVKDPLTGRKVFDPAYTILTKKPIVPSDAEIAENPRSRSAKFRAIQRI